jgi:hypothetical protein
MSAAEVQEAQEELAGRFSPAALAFLKARAAKKQQQQRQQLENKGGVADSKQEDGTAAATAAGGAAAAAGVPMGMKKGFLASSKSAAGPASTPTAAAAAGAQAVPTKQPAAAASGGGFKKGFLASPAACKPQQQQQQQQQQQLGKAQKQGTAAKQSAAAHMVSQAKAAAAKAAAASATPAPFEPLPPVARLRFSLDGQVLELADAKTPPTPDEEVLLRDNMSRAAGVVPQGYTLPEMRVLVRSGHAPQRAAGFRMLAVVLRRAQPSVLHVGQDGQLMQQPVLIEQQQQQQDDGSAAEQQHEDPYQQQQQQHQYIGSADQQQQQQQQQQSTGVHWAQVWEYAIVALRAILLCRLGLDDEHGQVLSAAADAAAVLLGLSPSEALIEEVGVGVCSAAAGLSWPVSRRVSLRRLGKAGAWDRVQGLVAAAAAAQQQQQAMPEEEVGGELIHLVLLLGPLVLMLFLL